MVKKIFLAGALAMFVLVPVLAHGATIKAEKNYYLDSASTLNDNLYAVGGDVNIAGTVNGDLMVAGGNLIVTGPVSGDIAGAGGTINLSNNVAGDIRVAGGNITVLNSAGGDLVVAGGQVNIMSESSVGKDGEIAGGNINYAGSVAGKLNIKGGNVYFNGTTGGNLVITAKEIKLGPNAVVGGNFDYYSPAEASMAQGSLVQGASNFHKTEMPLKNNAKPLGALGFGFTAFALVIKSIMILVAALVMIYFFKNQSEPIVSNSVSSFWKEALKGFVILVVVPIAVILSFITVIGVFLGIITALFYALLIVVSSIISVLLFAQLCLKYIFKKPDYQLNWWVVILAVIVFAIISLIPFVGWIFTLIIFLSAFGSTSKYIYGKIRQ
jgi:hypothetical protein